MRKMLDGIKKYEMPLDMEAFLYSRWSSLEQQGTTSAPRQMALNEAFAQREGWPIAERLADEGVSAWTGANIAATGNLGKLIERLEREGGNGKVLVVEKLDRLSRQPPLVMAGWVQRACATGLVIATADGRHRIDSEGLLRNQMTILGLIFEAFVGFDESQKKSDRVSEAWALKRDRAAPMTRLCPGWLTISARDTAYRSATNADARYEVIEARAAIVRRIFDMADAGKGKATICRILNLEGVPTFGSSDGWQVSYVKKILANPAVIGEFQPCTKPKGGERLPAGDVIRDYYPAIITVEQFERVNDAKAKRVIREQSGHNPLVNLLSGLGRCEECGGTMTLINKGQETLASGEVVPRRYLVCSSAHRAHGCQSRTTFAYQPLIGSLLDRILPLAMDDQHFASQRAVGEIESRLIVAKRGLADARRRQEIAYSAMEADGDDELAARRYRERTGEVKSAKADVARLQSEADAAQAIVSPTEHLARVAEVRSMMDSSDEAERYEARRRVKVAMNHIIATVRFSGEAEKACVVLGPGVRHIVMNRNGSVDVDGSIWRDHAVESDAPAVKSYFARMKAA